MLRYSYNLQLGKYRSKVIIDLIKGLYMEEKENMVRHLENGVDLVRENDKFYAVVGEEKLEITHEEVLLILSNHELAFNVIINAKRKHDFNTFMDRYSPMEY
jgi:hypothetical protein